MEMPWRHAIPRAVGHLVASTGLFPRDDDGKAAALWHDCPVILRNLRRSTAVSGSWLVFF